MPKKYVESLSKKPSQIRNRIRQRGVDLQRDMEMLYKKPIEDWDLEELAHGRPRNKAGNFAGATPSWITPAVLEESKRRLLGNTFGNLAGFANLALEVVKRVMTSEDVDDNGRPLVDAKTKLAAAQFVLEHIIGKPKALVEIDDPASMRQRALAAAIVLDDGHPQGHLAVIEGEVLEDDAELAE